MPHPDWLNGAELASTNQSETPAATAADAASECLPIGSPPTIAAVNTAVAHAPKPVPAREESEETRAAVSRVAIVGGYTMGKQSEAAEESEETRARATGWVVDRLNRHTP
jgi:hypothetical protein